MLCYTNLGVSMRRNIDALAIYAEFQFMPVNSPKWLNPTFAVFGQVFGGRKRWARRRKPDIHLLISLIFASNELAQVRSALKYAMEIISRCGQCKICIESSLCETDEILH
jgi:hypothetical protein